MAHLEISTSFIDLSFSQVCSFEGKVLQEYFCCDLSLLVDVTTTTGLSPSPTSTLKPPFLTTLPTLHLRCAWSPWLNSDRPNLGASDTGDMETVAGLRSKFGLCKNIVDIQCRVAGSHTPSSATGQVGVLCDVANGLRCFNG